MTAGQEDPVEHLQEELNAITTLFGQYFSTVQYRHEEFRLLVTGEINRVDALKTNLRREVEELALELSQDGTDVTICLEIALESVTNLIEERGK